MSSTDSPAPVTPRKNVRDLKTPSVLGTYNAGMDSYNSLATEVRSVRTDMAEKFEPLGENVERILEIAEGLVEFVNGNHKTLEGVLEQATAGVSGPVSLVDVHQMGQVLLGAIHEEGVQTRWLIERQAVEMRSFIDQCTKCLVMFIAVLFLLAYVHSLWTPVCAMAPPVSNVTDWSEFAKNVRNEFVKNARDEWAH
jgi:hypothetical protein